MQACVFGCLAPIVSTVAGMSPDVISQRKDSVANTKIYCLGGGSLYFPRVLADLALEQDLGGSEIVLYDIDVEKADLMADLGRRVQI